MEERGRGLRGSAKGASAKKSREGKGPSGGARADETCLFWHRRRVELRDRVGVRPGADGMGVAVTCCYAHPHARCPHAGRGARRGAATLESGNKQRGKRERQPARREGEREGLDEGEG